MTHLTIDPVTRVGGHLRIEADVEHGVVSDAWSSVTMYRGIEPILKGRDPRDVWLLAQRVCGACSGVHGLASVRAVEDALGVRIPANARSVRNLLMASEFVLDHVTRFFQQEALDWVDPAAALAADPAATAILARSLGGVGRSDLAYFRDARERLAEFVRSGGSGPFFERADQPAGDGPPETSLMVMAHYLDVLDRQRQIVRFQTFLGGKSPHPQTYLLGGSAVAVPWGGPPATQPGQHPSRTDPRAPATLSPEGFAEMAAIAGDIQAMVAQAYLPSVLAIAKAYPGWANLGRGYGNYLSFGEFPLDDADKPTLLLPRGRVLGGDLRRVAPIQQLDIGETVAHSHYTYGDGDAAYRHPSDGLTVPSYGGPTPPFATVVDSDRYSWVKAPRYQRAPMEAGPLARVLVAYVEGRGVVKDPIDDVVSRLGLGPDALFSTLGRILAAAVEAQILADQLPDWLDGLRANLADGDLAVADLTRWVPESWPSRARGLSLGEGPGGAVGHWLSIDGGLIDEYQIVDASTWNLSPRDAGGGRGALEQALIGTPVADPANPVEILRTVHSLQPCTACGAQ